MSFTFPFANAITTFGANLAPLQRGIAQANAQLSAFAANASRQLARGGPGAFSAGNALAGGGARSVAGLARLGGLGAGAGAGATVFALGKLGSDAEEMEIRFQQVFRHLSDGAEQFSANLANSIGRSKYALMDMITNFQLEFTASGLGREEALGMSQSLQKLTLDLAAFHNMSEQDVGSRLFRALVGNHRALYELGIVMNKATLQEEMLRMGWKKQFEELTNLEKMQLRMSFIMRSTGDAQGQAAREADNLAGRWRALTGLMSDAATDAGKMLVPPLREALDVMVRLLETAKQYREMVSGKSDQSDQGQAGAGSDWRDMFGAAGWASKKLASGGDWHMFKNDAPEMMGRRMAYLAGYGKEGVGWNDIDQDMYDERLVREVSPDRRAANVAAAKERRDAERGARAESDKDAFLGARNMVLDFQRTLKKQAEYIEEVRNKRADEDDKVVEDVVRDAMRQADEATNRNGEYWDDGRSKKEKREATPQFSGLVEFAKAFQTNAMRPFEEKLLEVNRRQADSLKAIDLNQKKMLDMESAARDATFA